MKVLRMETKWCCKF